MKRYLYMAEPIDQRSGQGARTMRLITAARHARVNIYSPASAWYFPGGGPFPPDIQQVNNQALAGAVGLVASWASTDGRPHPTIGVPMEIERALSMGLPVAVFADWDQASSGAMAGAAVDLWTDDLTEITSWMIDRMQAEPNPQTGLFVVPDPPGLQAAWMQGEGRYPNEAPPPRAGHPGDAGYDLTAVADVTIDVGEQGQIPCGIAVQLPEGYWALIQGRSSSWRRGLDVKPSIIDAGYRGDLWIDCYNIGEGPVQIKAGERIGQLIPMPLAPRMSWVQVDQLEPSDRGSAGYGSTGR